MKLKINENEITAQQSVKFKLNCIEVNHMGILSVFKKKQQKEPEQFVPRAELPEELERFRMPEQTVKDREFHTFARKMSDETNQVSDFPPIGKHITVEEALRREELPIKSAPLDKLDLIISKLETIDERLKLIEERLGRRI